MPNNDELNELVNNSLQLFYLRLKELRLESKSTQLDVANAINITDRAYRNLESGKAIPRMDTFLSLAKYFNINVDYLAGSSDVKSSY